MLSTDVHPEAICIVPLDPVTKKVVGDPICVNPPPKIVSPKDRYPGWDKPELDTMAPGQWETKATTQQPSAAWLTKDTQETIGEVFHVIVYIIALVGVIQFMRSLMFKKAKSS